MTDSPKILPTLPTEWYLDPAHYARELEAIWYRDWVCVGRLEQIPEPGDYFLAEIGSQQIIVTRDADRVPRAWHNTCRHRGSVLCTSSKGRFRNGRIICPYHTWTYDLDGRLISTPFRIDSSDFDAGNYSLYDVAIDTWGGFIFVCLDESPGQSLGEFLGDERELLSSWPLEALVVVREEVVDLDCNWKIFWENYSECYHCPRVHPELCKVVPLYGEGLTDHMQQPDWQPDDNNVHGEPGVSDGMNTWTLDGRSGLPEFEGLDEDKKAAGMWFASFAGSMFVVGHPQYVRSVRLSPMGPERIRLVVQWLLLPGIAEQYPDELDHIHGLSRLIVEQDGRACELNQRGLHSRRHREGVLVPQENWVADFHDWLREKLSAADLFAARQRVD
jgi:Rieske 2Fe-2S family protein